MGLRKWVIEKLGGVTNEESDKRAEAIFDNGQRVFETHSGMAIVDGKRTAKLMSASRSVGNRVARFCEEKEVNGHMVIAKGTLRINEPRKKLKDGT